MRPLALIGVGVALTALAGCGDDGPDRFAAHVAANRQRSAGELVLSDVVCPPIDGYTGPVADQGVGGVEDGAIAVDAGDFFFSPTCAVQADGETVSMTVTNSGGILHNVSIAEQGIDVDIPPGQTVVIEVAVAPEALVYICKYHRTAGMVGAVIPAPSA